MFDNEPEHIARVREPLCPSVSVSMHRPVIRLTLFGMLFEAYLTLCVLHVDLQSDGTACVEV